MGNARFEPLLELEVFVEESSVCRAVLRCVLLRVGCGRIEYADVYRCVTSSSAFASSHTWKETKKNVF